MMLMYSMTSEGVLSLIFSEIWNLTGHILKNNAIARWQLSTLLSWNQCARVKLSLLELMESETEILVHLFHCWPGVEKNREHCQKDSSPLEWGGFERGINIFVYVSLWFWKIGLHSAVCEVDIRGYCTYREITIVPIFILGNTGNMRLYFSLRWSTFYFCI